MTDADCASGGTRRLPAVASARRRVHAVRPYESVKALWHACAKCIMMMATVRHRQAQPAVNNPVFGAALKEYLPATHGSPDASLLPA